MRFHLENFGCRATQADGWALTASLGTRGYEPVASAEQADLLVLNTCTVTAAADQQARERIRQLHRLNPRGRILVTGCYAQRAPAELAALPGVGWVIGNSHKSQIPQLLEGELTQANFVPLASLSRFNPAAPAAGELSLAERPARLPDGQAKILTGDILAETTLSAPALRERPEERTRPVLKIQDGCNHRCAYCVIPFVRGRSRSLPPARVLDAIRRWVDAGVNEVVLSGIDLGSYGEDLPRQNGRRPNLLALTERILAETSLPLLRFSSIEPADLSPDFLEHFASADRIARHLHVPLQSGSDRILRRMARPYRARDYAECILAAAEKVPNAGLGADVIVGFPGETEEDFEATCRLVEELPFSYLHVFSFSKRPGTRAWAMNDDVPAATIRARARALRALAAAKQHHFRESQIGRTLRVLTLQRTRPSGGREALSENYLQVVLAGPDPGPNQLLSARITAVDGDALLGTA
ncbi:MAG: tRNA (N(6)-L-threonylcarbamoyladenosine(37)-C(2))-methylthiotransferase MtaB [Acidobacteria bacterium]|nr:tRNA (N(6)-L-threonylcarbamoyladenosine(37)-C(2))-methylthiotransferase MtaB [Acidobacteriota bacterium]